MGFFLKLAPSKTVPHLPRCGSCNLHKNCESPKISFVGEGRRKILIVGGSPNETEDEERKQFVGSEGREFRKIVEGFGIDLYEDCWSTFAVRCRVPKDGVPNNRQIEWCRPDVMKNVRECKPSTVILLGASAAESLLGFLWKPSIGPLERWIGWKIPSQQLNAWVCPVSHPSDVSKAKDPIVELIFREHLEAAFDLSDRPWQEVPDYRKDVECIMDVDRAAKIIRGMIKRGGPVAFDYETDRLKPDHPDARIVSCSVCWQGKRTIAYPWIGRAVRASRELLSGFEQKIGWNIKFEERWTRKALGNGVSNWLWDGMQASHCLDNRRAISSLKFQSFVRLGLAPYDESIGPYLKAKGSNEKNQIDRADMRELSFVQWIGFVVDV